MEKLFQFIDNVVNFIINPLIGLLFALAFVMFIWGSAQLIIHSGDAENRKKHQSILTWGLVGMFIMASVFGILQVVLGTFNVELPGRQIMYEKHLVLGE